MKVSFTLKKLPILLKRRDRNVQLSSIAFSVLLLLFSTFTTYAQNNHLVKGRIINESGEPIPGSSILVKGTTAGVNSNDNGTFEINAPNNGTLIISSVGFTTREIKVNNQTNVTITLVSVGKEMEQVVVVGYGTQRRKDVTGSVVSVSEATLKEVAAPNLIAQLKGRTAGVDIVSNSSTPGGGGSIRIRGNRTITNSQSTSDALDQPLLVVDGIPYGGSINDINPEDVASLEILKDASATAIYGSRGAGGVIIVTTKRGNKAGKALMSYDAYYGISNVMGKLKVFSGPELAQFKLDAATYNRTGPGTSSYFLTNAEQAALTAGISTDWQGLIYQQGFTTSHQLSLSGGTEGTQYGLSGGYYNETGIIPNQKFERYSLRSTIDHQISRHLKIGINTVNTLSYSNTPGGGGVPGGLVRLTPLAAPYNADGSVNMFPAIGSVDATAISPLTLITKPDAMVARNRRLRTFNSLYGEWLIINGLRYRVNVGLDYQQSQGTNYSGPLTYVNTATVLAQANENVSNSEAYRYDIQNLLYYDKTFAQKHKIGFTGLFEVQKDHSFSNQVNGVGIPADYIQYTNIGLANSSTATNNSGAFQESAILSYMARLNYSYDNRYNLTATIRTDASSVLSPTSGGGNQYFTYPSVAAGWTISNEKFMGNVPFISNLKLRGGWGKTGNQGVSPYATLGILSASAYDFGQGALGQQAAYIASSLANKGLHWQSTSQWDIGLEFGILKNRITGNMEVYDQRTNDILLPFRTPPSLGYSSSTNRNLGKTKGHGIELNINSINIQSKSGVTWSTELNFYFNREEIVQLQFPGSPNDIGNGWFIGQPLTVIYDVKKIGIWQTADSGKALAAQTTPIQFPGQIRIQDLNGDGKIDQNDRQVLGNFQPKWEGGITNRVSYKGFDLSVVIFARMGMEVLVPYVTDDGGAQGFPFFMQSRVNQVKVNYWTRSNPTNDFPAPDAGTDRFLFGSTLGYVDGSFIKCRSINLGYEVPAKILTKAGISSLRVYVTAINPFIIYSPFVRDGFGPDPEGNGYGGSVNSINAGNSTPAPGRQVSVNANNPSTRQWNLGINLKF